MSQKVIVFGPTGAVGSAAALTAGELGAHVALAMRDTSKALPSDLAALESSKAGQFERVTADLEQPETVGAAVTKSGAKRAFIYLAHGGTDHMRGTLEALKAAGVEYVVFLSSFSVEQGADLAAIPPSDGIPYVHAQVEINLHAVFGDDGFVALRPGSFAGNTRQYQPGLNSGVVSVFAPQALSDNIVQEDIGRVGGTLLVKGSPDGNVPVYLYGPRIQSQVDNIKTLAKVLGKDPEIKEATEEETRHLFINVRKVPEGLADYMIRQTKKAEQRVPGQTLVFGIPIDLAHLGNVQKYSGHPPTTFETWAEKNKHLFA